jgi:hypothetical protein
MLIRMKWNPYKFSVEIRRHCGISRVLLRTQWRSDVQDLLRSKKMANSPALRRLK